MDNKRVNITGAVVLGFVSGLALALFLSVESITGIFILTLSFGVLSVGLFLLPSYGEDIFPLALVSLFLIGIGLGIFRVDAVTSEDETLREEGDIRIYGTVVSYPEDRESYLLFSIQSNIVESELVCREHSEEILVRADRFANVSYGDRVIVSGELSKPEPFETDTGRLFHYDKYLAVEGISRIVSFARVTVLEHDQGNPALATLFRIKRAYVDSLERLLPEPEASLAAGITAGTRGGLSDEFREDLIHTGVIHIVVLSGYNVAIIIASVIFVFRFLAQAARLVVAAALVTLFVLLAGAEPSLVRAALMAFIVLGAAYANRSSDALRALAVAAVVMLVVQPFILWSPTFILSFLATWGLIAFSPYLEEKLIWVKPYGIRITIAATTATQLAVLPYLLYAIGEVSLVALPTNIVILLSIPLAMLFSFLAGLLGIVAYPVGVAASWVAFAFLKYETLMIDLFARVPFAAVVIPPFSVAFLFLAYALLGVIWRRYLYRNTLSQREGVRL